MVYAQLIFIILAGILFIVFVSTDDWRRERKKNKEKQMINNEALKNIDELQGFIEKINLMQLSAYRREDLLKHIRYAIDGMKRDFIEELGQEAFNNLKKTENQT